MKTEPRNPAIRGGQWVRVEDSPGPVWVWKGDDPPLTETALSWRQALLIAATAMAFIVLIPIAAVYFSQRSSQNDRIQAAKEQTAAAIRRERDLRVEFNRQLNSFVFDQCVAAEKRDTIIVKVLALIENPPPVVREAIDALEPADERDCTPPPASGTP